MRPDAQAAEIHDPPDGFGARTVGQVAGPGRRHRSGDHGAWTAPDTEVPHPLATSNLSVVPAEPTISAAEVVSSRICWRALASSATTVTCLRCAVQAVELRHQLIRDLFRRNDCDTDLGRCGGMKGAHIGQVERQLQAEHAQDQDHRAGGDGVLPLVPETQWRAASRARDGGPAQVLVRVLVQPLAGSDVSRT